MSNRTRIVAAFGTLLVLCVSLFTIYSFIANRGKVGVFFVVAPSNSQILIDGNKSGVKTRLKPGEYQIKVSKSGFETYTNKLIVKSSSRSLRVPIVLNADEKTSLSESDAKDYEKAIQQAQEIGATNTQNAGIAERKNNPIVDLLPVLEKYYRIDYSYKDSNQSQLVLEITADTATGRYLAIQKIFDMGYDPTNYKVRFLNLTSAFDGQGGI